MSNWVSTQRQERKLLNKGHASRLTKDRVDALEMIGFVWEAQRHGKRKKANRSAPSNRDQERKPMVNPNTSVHQSLGVQREAQSPSMKGNFLVPPSAMETYAAVLGSADASRVGFAAPMVATAPVSVQGISQAQNALTIAALGSANTTGSLFATGRNAREQAILQELYRGHALKQRMARQWPMAHPSFDGLAASPLYSPGASNGPNHCRCCRRLVAVHNQ